MYKHTIYFLIGAPRTGSTYLHNILKQNKKINLLPKENHFFLSSTKIFGGINYFVSPKYYFKTSIKYYLQKLSLKKINYDINTLYFYDLKALKLIKKKFPNSKFFCVLRNPVDRHYSHSLTQIKKYYYYRDRGDFKFSIDDFCDIKKGSLFENHFLSCSNYFFYKNLLKNNKIRCKYFSYEYLFSKKNNYLKFLKEIKVKNLINLKSDKHSNKNYPYKFYRQTYISKIRNFLFEKYYRKKIDETLLNFKKNYPYNNMIKLFKTKKEKNLKNLKKYLDKINLKN